MVSRVDSLIQDSLKSLTSPSANPISTTSSELTFEIDPEDFGDSHQSLTLPAKQHPEAYYLYAPLMKALLDKYHGLLDLEGLTPNLPSQSANFIAEFRDYLQGHPQEWYGGFLGKVVNRVAAAAAFIPSLLTSSIWLYRGQKD